MLGLSIGNRIPNINDSKVKPIDIQNYILQGKDVGTRRELVNSKLMPQISSNEREIAKNMFQNPELQCTDLINYLFGKCSPSEVLKKSKNGMGELALSTEFSEHWNGIVRKIQRVVNESGYDELIKNLKKLSPENPFHNATIAIKANQFFDTILTSFTKLSDNTACVINESLKCNSKPFEKILELLKSVK